MKSIKILCSLLLVLTVCSAFSLKGSKSVYIVGVSASFTDSLVYFTEIQLLDSVSLDKNKMLPERSQYSYQAEKLSGKRGRADEPYLLCLFLEQQKETAEDHQQDEDQVSKRKDLADSRSEPQCVQVQETGRVILFL